MRPFLYLLLLLHVALLPFERLLRVVSASGEDSILKPYRVVGLVFSGLWLAWRTATGHRIRLDVGDKSFIALFAFGGLLALFWHVVEGTNDLDLTARGLQLIFFGVAVYVAIKDIKLTRREIEVVLITYASTQVFAVALAQVFFGEATDGRLRGLYRNPNQLGIAAATSLVFLFGQFALASRPTLGGQLVRAFVATGLVAVIALSGSRGATAGAVVGVVTVLVMALSRRGKGGFAPARMLAFVAMVGVLVAAGYGRFEQAWEQTSSQTRFQRDVAVEGAEGRWELWQSGFNVGLNHYGVGVGTMQYLTYHLDSMREIRVPVSSADRPLGTHSDYVDLFASYGIVGVWIFFRYIVIRFRSLWAASRAHGPASEFSYLAPFGVALLLAELTFQVGQNSFQASEYFLVMGLIDSIARAFEASPERASTSARPVRTFSPLNSNQASA